MDAPADRPAAHRPRRELDALETVRSALTGVRPLVTLSREGLTLIALESQAPLDRADYLTFPEASERGAVEVRETAQATVPTVEAETRDADVLLLGGDTIVGGKQNRIINVTIWLKAGKKTHIPVSCLEAGRWSQGLGFAAGRKLDHSMRAMVNSMVVDDVARSASPEPRFSADQGGIWAEIGRKQARAAVHTPTAALHEVYAAEAEDVGSYVLAFPYPTGASGLAVAIGGRVTGLDLFDSPETLQKQWPRLVESAASAHLDHRRMVASGLAPAPRHRYPDADALGRLLKRATDALQTATVQRSVGEGIDVRLAGEKVHGSALVNRGRAVHVALFRRGA